MKRSFFISIFILFSSFNFAFAQSDSIYVERNFLVHSDKIEISLIIHKPAHRGFARIYERLPDGATVKNVIGGAAYFKSEKTMLKIAWDDIPEDTIVKVYYYLILDRPLQDTLSAFEGTFSAEFISTESENVKIISKEKKYQKELLITKKNEIKNSNTNQQELKIENKTKVNIANDKSTYICIQVAAVGENVNSDYLMKKFNYPGVFDSHFEGKFYRITIGKYQTVTEAQTAMNELKSKYFQKCFLSAYHNGEKIDVYKAEKLLK